MLSLRSLGLCLIWILLLTGCTTVFLNSPNRSDLNSLGEPRTLEMQMQVSRGESSHAMELVVDVHKQGLTVIGSAFGARVFTLSYDGDVVSEGVGLGLPIALPNKLIIDDVILALVTRRSLEAGLPKDCSLVVDGGWRKISCNGEFLVNINHQLMPDKNELVTVERLQPKYKVNFIISEVK